MKNKIILISGALLTIAAAVFYSLLLLNGISAETGLISSNAYLYLANGLSLAVTVFWILAAFFLLDLPRRITEKKRRPAKDKERKAEKKEKEEEPPRPIDPLVLDKLPKHAAAFYVTFLFILMAVSLFMILYTAKDFSVFHLALAVLAVLTTVAFMRIALLHVTESAKTYDVFLLPVPIVFSVFYAILVYQSVARMPQISVYYPKILALMGVILVFYLFTSHFFGEPPRRLHVCAALFTTSFCGMIYLVDLVVLFSHFFASEIVSAGDYFADIASLMLYASAAILGAVYVMLLLRGREVPSEASRTEEAETGIDT